MTSRMFANCVGSFYLYLSSDVRKKHLLRLNMFEPLLHCDINEKPPDANCCLWLGEERVQRATQSICTIILDHPSLTDTVLDRTCLEA
jgi:hypothetical protein